jgi:hypothetical protein
MAISKGWQGSLVIGTDTVGSINNWEINFAEDALENTAFGSTTPYDRTYQPGLRAHTVTISGYADPASDTAQMALLNGMRASTEPAAVTIVCYYNTTTPQGWTGSAVVTGLTVGMPVDGLSPFSGTFQVSGGLSTI